MSAFDFSSIPSFPTRATNNFFTKISAPLSTMTSRLARDATWGTGDYETPSGAFLPDRILNLAMNRFTNCNYYPHLAGFTLDSSYSVEKFNTNHLHTICLVPPRAPFDGKPNFVATPIARASMEYGHQYFNPHLFTMIPIVFNKGGLSTNHVVMVLIDPKTKQVEYYDSKGEKSSSIRLASGKTLYNCLELIKNKFFHGDTEAKIVENDVRHQGDIHNCGAYVVNFVYLRIILGLTFDEIKETKISTESMNTLRKNNFNFY